MKLLDNIILQQTSPTFFIVSIIAVLLFIVIIGVVGGSKEKNDNKQKEDWVLNNSDKFKIQDDFILNFINPLSIQTPKCNKCNSNVYNIWDINSRELNLKCAECKKNYKLELIEESTVAINSISKYIEFVQEALINGNEKIREYLKNKLIYNFSSLRNNQPLIRAISFVTKSEKIATSTKFNFKLIGYTNYYNFNKDEYFEKENIELKDLNSLFFHNEVKDNIIKTFDENLSKNQITLQMPAIIFGVQKEITIYRNGLLENKIDDIKNQIKESRRISQSTKDKVWRRDEGKCVECGSKEKLEFDHIIPFSKGGSNTYRNIQLLCEPCNRSKSDKIG
ncbi:HNH endonuclease [Polaribacter gangjinensis]|uniref:HNH nuclease domain-containing protein n=1 Tax=Polaribacter gangjinensis TaxID=574710 RepID=A0A2S7WA01_9FLAO|nr:HNH endonuclease [Polaribacter gangjinensis]PQJ74464.1 hypothetical protein BTO13_03900 [Polaribacter gangjinensis]